MTETIIEMDLPLVSLLRFCVVEVLYVDAFYVDGVELLTGLAEALRFPMMRDFLPPGDFEALGLSFFLTVVDLFDTELTTCFLIDERLDDLFVALVGEVLL